MASLLIVYWRTMRIDRPTSLSAARPAKCTPSGKLEVGARHRVGVAVEEDVLRRDDRVGGARGHRQRREGHRGGSSRGGRHVLELAAVDQRRRDDHVHVARARLVHIRRHHEVAQAVGAVALAALRVDPEDAGERDHVALLQRQVVGAVVDRDGRGGRPARGEALVRAVDRDGRGAGGVPKVCEITFWSSFQFMPPESRPMRPLRYCSPIWSGGTKRPFRESTIVAEVNGSTTTRGGRRAGRLRHRGRRRR
jgi:hypothetical protein